MPLEKVAEGGGGLTSPTFDKNGVLHVCCQQTGAVCKVVDGRLEEVLNTQGQPSAIAFDPVSNHLYVCDLAHQAILREEDEGQGVSLTEFVAESEGQPLLGPTALAFDAAGTLYFADSGPFGETTLANPRASVYAIPSQAALLHPVAPACLAHAAGLAVAPGGAALYACDALRNRILRFAQRPTGVWHASVFHTFNGGLGPMAIACDGAGALYVARFDFRENATEGTISIVAANGQLLAELAIPGAEVTGLCFDAEFRFLYLTEASANAVYRYDVQG